MGRRLGCTCIFHMHRWTSQVLHTPEVTRPSGGYACRSTFLFFRDLLCNLNYRSSASVSPDKNHCIRAIRWWTCLPAPGIRSLSSWMPHPVQKPGQHQATTRLLPTPSFKSVDIRGNFAGIVIFPVRSRYDGYHAIFLPFTRVGYTTNMDIYCSNFIPIEYLCQSTKIGLFLTVLSHKDPVGRLAA